MKCSSDVTSCMLDLFPFRVQEDLPITFRRSISPSSWGENARFVSLENYESIFKVTSRKYN